MPTRIGSPPTQPGVNRDDAAYDAIGPAVVDLLNAALKAGWAPGEALVAVLFIVIDEMRDGAGAPATIQMLQKAIKGLRAEGRSPQASRSPKASPPR